VSTTPVDIFVPTTLTGVCFASGDLPISTGAHQITLMVGNCPNSPFTNAASGFYSTSRLLVEEIPRRKRLKVETCCWSKIMKFFYLIPVSLGFGLTW
jgi:hypothetical protein